VHTVRRSEVWAPDSAWRDCWRRLESRRSFRFRLDYSTDSPLPVTAHYTGRWLSPDREAWEGEWVRGGERRAVSLRASGERQYESQGGGWTASQRGVETRIIEQLRQVVRAPRASFEGRTGGVYVFAFSPDLRFLDPAGQKSFRGRAEVDVGLGVPIRVSCTDSAGTASWNAEFRDFDHPVRIELPFASAMSLDLVPGRRLAWCRRGAVRTGLARRLDEMSWQHRLRWQGRALRVELAEARPGHVLGLLGSEGVLQLWSCRALQGDSFGGDRPLAVGGDASRRVVLDYLLGANPELPVDVRTPTPVEPLLRVRPPRVPAAGTLVALVLDGEVLSTATASDSGTADFADIGSLETARAIGAIAATAPLPTRLVVR
jgi:hypothetical protein